MPRRNYAKAKQYYRSPERTWHGASVTRQGDTVEFSPTSQAKCRACHQQIEKGTRRIGKESYCAKYGGFIHGFYHENCCPTSVKKNLTLPNHGSVGDEILRKEKQERKQRDLLQERRGLYEALREIRKVFGNRLECSNKLYMILTNKALEEMTVNLPKSKAEMLNIYGMGPKKYESFGEAFLTVVQHFRRMYERSKKRAATAGPIVVVPAAASIPVPGDDNDLVVQMETLSCAEIVQRKFDHAAANGYVITLD